MRKKGEMVGDAAIELIIAVAVAMVLILLIVKLYNPGYDEADEIAKSYFETLKDGVSEGGGEILMLDRGSDGFKFYLAYFGGAGSLSFVVEEGERVFVPKVVGGHVVCVCYDRAENVVCRHCEDLDLPTRSVGGIVKENVFWVIEDGDRVEVEKKEGIYVFSIE